MVPYIVELRGLWFDTVVIIDGLKLLSMSNTSVILNRAIVCFYTVKLNGDFPRSMSYRDMWDKYSNTALIWASQNGHKEIVKILLEKEENLPEMFIYETLIHK